MANSTTLVGSTISQAVASDPDLCRISGYLIDAQGNPLRGWTLTLVYRNVPVGIGTASLVLRERLTFQTDVDGYVQFDLLRGAKLTAEIPNFLTWLAADTLTVPDASSCDLIAFLFPYIVSVAFTDAGPTTLAVDDRITITFTATLSNGETLLLGSDVVEIDVSNDAVLQFVELNIYQAIAAGSADVTAAGIDTSKVTLHTDRYENVLEFFGTPDPTLPTDPLVVTVS